MSGDRPPAPMPKSDLASVPGRGRLGLGLVVLAVFTSAFLLLLVQPLAARHLLPVLGGTPAVWAATIAFFQVGLLLGYALAHLVGSFARGWVLALAPAALLGLAALLLPLGDPRPDAPADAGVLWLLGALVRTVGLPFVALSATGTLLQRVVAGSRLRQARDPYVLYAASNLGSLGALLLYPVAIEPALRLASQRAAWSWTFGVLALLALGVGLVLRTDRPPEGSGGAPTSGRRRLHWLVLAAVPSSLYLGVTTHITTNLAAVPLLWVLPLAIYLLSFVIAFLPRAARVVRGAQRALPWAALVTAASLLLIEEHPGWLMAQVVLQLVFLLIACVAVHGRLAALRPPAAGLTGYYLVMSVGGAIGGSFNAFVAPALFNDTWEHPLALVLAVLLGRASARAVPTAPRASRPWRVVLAPVAVIGAYELLRLLGKDHGADVDGLLLLVLPAIAAACFVRWRRSYALALLGLLAIPYVAFQQDFDVLHSERTFFGVHKVFAHAYDVTETGGEAIPFHRLLHGTTVHGEQLWTETLRDRPTLYHSFGEPVADVLALVAARTEQERVAVVGLGAGALCPHARPGGRWTFYEIDDEVVRIAQNPAWFSFLRDCRAQSVEVVVADGRLGLARATEARYDVIVLDAFSSDAVPMHLLTREAVAIYLERLAPGGLLLFNISNHHVDLEPVLARLAEAHALEALIAPIRKDQTMSTWVVMGRDVASLGALPQDPHWVVPVVRDDVGLWTDDHASLWQVLR